MADIHSLILKSDSTQIKKSATDLDGLSNSAKKADTATGKFSATTNTATTSLIGMKTAVVSVVAALGIDKLVKYADTWAMVNSRLQLATDSTVEFSKAQTELFEIAQETRQEFESTADLYSRMARATKSLGVSQDELLTVTKSINQALIVSGASTQEASSVITQLGQGLASGVLRGEEFNSIMENGSRVAMALADSLGVTLGELRAMAKEGQLTSDVVVNSLIKQSETIDKEFSSMAVTVSQSWTTVSNSILQTVGNIDEVTNASSGLSDAMLAISDALTDNQEDLKHFAIFSMATIDRMIDGFNLLQETAEFGIEQLISLPQVALQEFVAVIAEQTYDLSVLANDIAATLGAGQIVSDEELTGRLLQANLALEKSNQLTKELKGESKEVLDAFNDWNMTVDERVAATYRELRAQEQLGEQIKTNSEIGSQEQEITSIWDEFDEYRWDLEQEALEEKNRLIEEATNLTKTQAEILNEQFLMMQEAVQGIFDESQMEKFYAKWGQELDKITKKEKKNTSTRASSVSDLGSIYGDVSGLMSSFYDEGDSRRQKQLELDRTIKTITTAARIADLAMFLTTEATKQSMLATTALVAQLQLPFPANIPAYAAVAGMIASLGIAMSGSGGGAGGGSFANPDFEQNKTDIEDQNQPILDRLDRQIELLQELNFAGTAGIASISLGGQTFTRDIRLAAQDVAKAMYDTTYAWGFTLESLTEAQVRQAEAREVESRIAQTTGRQVDLLGETRLADIGGAIGYATPVLTEGFINKASESFEVTLSFLEAVNELGAFDLVGGAQSFDEVLNTVQKSLSEWVMSILDVANELKEASGSLKEFFDEITGTAYFATQELNEAFNDLDRLSQGRSYAQYIKDQVEILDNAQALFDEDLISLLLSTDVSDLSKQTAAIRQISEATGQAFARGAEDVLNYIDSIELVSEAISTSRKNIKEWNDSFKDANELAQDLASEAGVSLVSNMEDLQKMFIMLASDTKGLTDAEMELLEANRSLIESNVEMLNSALTPLNDTIERLRDAATGSDSSLDKFRMSMQKTLELSKQGDIDAFAASLKETTGASSVLFDRSAFELEKDQKFAQLVAANQFEELNNTSLTQIDLLTMIEENTENQVSSINEVLAELEKTATSTAQQAVQQAVSEPVAPQEPKAEHPALAHERMVLANYKEIFAFSPLYGGVTQSDIDRQQAKVDALSFAVGTPNVPHDMMANIHRGEIIVPETFSDGIRNGNLTMGNNDSVVAELREQNSLLNSIISELKEQTLIVDDTKDIQNTSLETLEKIEEAS